MKTTHLLGAQATAFVLAFTLAAAAQPAAPEAPPTPRAPGTGDETSPEAAGDEAAEPGEAQPAAPPAADPKLEKAKELFRKGNLLRKTGDYQKAFEFYLRSRELVPSVPNTLNAAYCLNELGRFDEALEMYEIALTEFADELSEQHRSSIGPQIQALRGKIGSVELSANTDGTVVIDGRQRGTLPLTGPIRVLPGERTVRIIKDGYETFERTIKVEAGKTVRVDASLSPLASSGRLRVEAPDAEGATLLVDGAAVGTLPWEGTLAPGEHVYVVEKEDLGSGPLGITVLQGQTVLARPELKPLGDTVRFVVEPPGTTFTLDGTPIGRSWQGRLPIGRHVLHARQEGYFPERRDVDVTKSTAGDVTVKLRVDPDHPRWAKASPSLFWLEAVVGGAISPSFGGDADSGCASTVALSDGSSVDGCSKRAIPLGFVAGARAGYQFAGGLSAELLVGYLYLRESLTRAISAEGEEGAFSCTDYRDTTSVAGPLAAISASYRLLEQTPLTFRLGGGLARASVASTNEGTFSGDVTNPNDPGDVLSVTDRVSIPEETRSVWIPFAWPEVRFGYRVTRRLEMSLGVAVMVMFPEESLRTGTNFLSDQDGERATALDDVPGGFADGTDARPGVLRLAREKHLGTFYVILPSLAGRFDFSG